MWAPIVAFSQRNILLQLQFSEEPIRYVPGLIVEHIQSELKRKEHDLSARIGSFVVLCSSKVECHKIYQSTELAMDAAEIDLDVIEIHGDLNKVTKFYRCRAFCSGEMWDGYDTERVVGCFGTSAIDVGFDHPHLVYQINIGWCHDWMQWRQCIGRLSRHGEQSTSYLIVGFSNYIFNAVSAQLRRFDPNLASPHDGQTNDLLNSNTTIFSPNATPQDRSDQTTNAQRRMVATMFHSHTLKMLRLICLNWGCVHRRLESLSGTGEMHVDPVTAENGGSIDCRYSCFVCTGQWGKLFRPVHLETAMHWFNSGVIRDAFPLVGNICDLSDFCNRLIRLVWDSPQVIEGLFDIKKSTISKGEVCCFFLQLIASDIIAIDVVSPTVLHWRISRELRWYNSLNGTPIAAPTGYSCDSTPLCCTARQRGHNISKFVYRYEHVDSWYGVNVFPNNHKKKYNVVFD